MIFYKKICAPIFAKGLQEIYKYINNDLKSKIGWKMTDLCIWQVINNDILAQDIKKYKIRRMTVDNYTVFYKVNHERREIYLLHLLYRKH